MKGKTLIRNLFKINDFFFELYLTQIIKIAQTDPSLRQSIPSEVDNCVHDQIFYNQVITLNYPHFDKIRAIFHYLKIPRKNKH